MAMLTAPATIAEMFQKYTIPVVITAILFGSFMYDKYQAQERELALITEVRQLQMAHNDRLTELGKLAAANGAKLDTVTAQASLIQRQHEDAAKEAQVARAEYIRRLDRIEAIAVLLERQHTGVGSGNR